MGATGWGFQEIKDAGGAGRAPPDDTPNPRGPSPPTPTVTIVAVPWPRGLLGGAPARPSGLGGLRGAPRRGDSGGLGRGVGRCERRPRRSFKRPWAAAGRGPPKPRRWARPGPPRSAMAPSAPPPAGGSVRPP